MNAFNVPAHLLLGKARVNHKHNAVNGQTRLSNVGGHNDLAPSRPPRPGGGRRRIEDLLLLLGGQG
jgi:hypothetical protein